MPTSRYTRTDRPDWAATMRALAEQKLGLSGTSLVTEFNELTDPPLWTSFLTGTGAVAYATQDAQGLGHILVSSGAGVGTAYVRKAYSPEVVQNMRTKKWFCAVRFYITGAVDANTQAFLGLLNVAGNKIGVGIDGAVSTTKFLVGSFGGVTPACTSATTQPSACDIATATATSHVDAYFYSDGNRVRFSVNGEPPIDVMASSALAATYGYIIPCLMGNIGGVTVHMTIPDCYSVSTER